jgi:hypothetical protein
MSNRPAASLSPTLLARKGAARPAMRPQLQPLRAFHESAARQLDDLGWNDMGHDGTETEAEPLVEQSAEEPKSAEIVALNRGAETAAARPPEVVRQQAEIPERMAAKATSSRRSAIADGRRAAFTLRLDPERHLTLRLASVTCGRSAQQIVTEALDQFLSDLPEVAELAAKVRESR